MTAQRAEDYLTLREREVLLRASHGETAKEIAQAFGVTPRAVEVHIMHVIRKLQARNRTHAVAIGAAS